MELPPNPRTYISKRLTKLYYLSDTHLEEHIDSKVIPLPELTQPSGEPTQPDEVVGIALLGDIGWFNYDSYWGLVRDCANRMDIVILILGNHEYHYLTIQEVPDDMRRELKSRQEKHPELKKVYFLEKDVLEFDNVRIFGSTFWTKPEPHVFLKLNERQMVKDLTHPYLILSIQTLYDIHENAKESLKKEIEFGDKPLIVLTHHAPLAECNGSRFENSFYTSAFVNRLLPSVWLRYPVIAWLYGHTHQNREFMKNGVYVATNALGYHRERLSVPYRLGAAFVIPDGPDGNGPDGPTV